MTTTAIPTKGDEQRTTVATNPATWDDALANFADARVMRLLQGDTLIMQEIARVAERHPDALVYEATFTVPGPMPSFTTVEVGKHRVAVPPSVRFTASKLQPGNRFKISVAVPHG